MTARRMRTGRVLLLTVVLLTSVTARSPAVGAAGAVHTLTPAPQAVVPAGQTVVAAWLSMTEPVERVDVTLDGAPVTPVTIEPAEPDRGRRIATTVSLAPGDHVVEVRAQDTSGTVATRSWHIVATATEVRRLAGADRYATAVAVSQTFHPDDGSAGAAVLARGDDFADALAGGPLAAASDAPLLLTHDDALPAATADELQRVLPPGATVHLLGGPAAMDEGIEDAVRDLGFEPRRHAGDDRYATAAAIASAIGASTHAFVVSGETFPDALAASVPAARDGSIVLLTRPHELPDVTARALDELGVEAVTIVGGAAVVDTAVQDELEQLVAEVERVAGTDRFATAAAVAARFGTRSGALAIARGDGFADALAGAPLLAQLDSPLLLSGAVALGAATVDALRGDDPARIVALGGPAVLDERLLGDVLAAAADGADAPHVVAQWPPPGASVRYLHDIRIATDQGLAAEASDAYVTIDGVETTAPVALDADRTLVISPAGLSDLARDVPHDVTVHVSLASAASGERLRRAWSFSYLPPDPHFGDAGPVALHLPSRDVELIGFHQSNHDGAQQVTVRDTATDTRTLESRGRGTGSRTAADIVANPDLPVYAPATGRVIRAGTYRLYCDHYDHYLVIEPDTAPGWEVKMLHFRDLAVGAGDRVVAGNTRVGSGPRALPFESQVDEVSHDRDWPHVHVEVVDPSIPDRPGPGC